ncbi:hypothetical protein [Butyrivibrio sp. WCE2006]|uniref:hypothetical protein n=1 Tax=Butyrivibrio sp. WCE2006 TaxID=1410611 RepID=UPI0005D247C6|nr:hypothetical protein [Butyrivibrio sp. WCE2006]
MKGIKRIGAMALATAMIISLAVPGSAKAAVYSSTTTVYDIDRQGTSSIENGTVKENVTGTIYRNRITGAAYDTSTKNADAERAATHYVQDVKKIEVGTDSYYGLSINPEVGQTLDSVKIKSGKANISIKQSYKYETTVYPSYDSKTKEVYFKKSDNTREVIATSESYPTEEQMKAWKRVDTNYTYRIFGKKPGKAKIEYTVSGKKTKVNVTVSDDARVFKAVSYAGKKLTRDLDRNATNANVWTSNTSNKAGINYVTKKSGKFKVTMGKNYKFVKAFVIKSTPYEVKTDADSYSYNSKYWSYSRSWSKSQTARQKTTGIDLNGDGDTLDTIYGINENDYSEDTVQVIGNNKKITLDTTPIKDEYTYTENDNGREYSTVRSSQSNMAEDTRIIVVYQNKITKTFGTDHFDITYRTSKN